ncbi:FadR/GntR family transcriptional regulator [Limimaricola pyoseonensis]|uniref:FadR/GntR family transcriptional regulator n=1 Tax=Limimaricola pyoseonensis TaxID=521013 RepID=UPI0013F4DE7E|nr:FCD domain-containing protein [Limimaricola pyoseonensis]
MAEALECLGRRIATGEVAEGEVLPVEADLVAELGVSRSTLREAVKTLVALGMVEVRTRHGTKVLPRRNWNILNRDVLLWMTSDGVINAELCKAIDEAREVIEPAAAAFAAKRASNIQIMEIRRAYGDMALAAEVSDLDGAIRADRAFHLAILAATGNPILEAFDSALDAVLGLLFVVATDAHLQSFRSNLVNHCHVLEAIERHDASAASAAMLETIWFTRSNLEAHNLTTAD